MRARITVGTALFVLLSTASVLAADSNMGTWTLNEAKSKLAAGMAKNTKVVYTAMGTKVKCVVDGMDAAGKPTHNEWVGMFDGKDYAVTGDPNTDMRAIKKVDDRHYEITTKKAGKTVNTGTIELSADGKTRTLTIHGTDAKGKATTSVTVYDKQ
jgi:polyphosphate kinase 2 (PPK2 family)